MPDQLQRAYPEGLSVEFPDYTTAHAKATWRVALECVPLTPICKLYMTVVLDLFSRQVIGWPMGSHIDTELVLNAFWRRRPKDKVLVHSDQGCQLTGHDRQGFLRDHHLISIMSRRGNCHDNAVAESFFQLLKRERVRRQIYPTRQ